MNAYRRNIILIGFSYTGKSQVGREVASRLDWPFIDTDEAIVALAGKTIPEIFAQDGEESFRVLERQALALACAQGPAVIATGGGVVLDEGNRALMAGSGVVVCLEAKPQTIYQRLARDAEQDEIPVIRPLLAEGNPLVRIQSLKEGRQSYYALADWTVHTDALAIEEVAEEVLRAWGRLRFRLGQEQGASYAPVANEAKAPLPESAACVVSTITQNYPVFVSSGALKTLGQRMRKAGLSGTAHIISDETVYALYGAKAEEALKEADFSVDAYTIPPGEMSKSLESAWKVYQWLVGQKAERGHIIVALGGGVVGDLAGFVAATYLRGMPVVQVPTTLLAMVDASIGGKTGVNLPQAKNLVGAFYQPRLVVSDVGVLSTLGSRERAEGWAETIKHALILDKELFNLMEQNATSLRALEHPVTAQVIARSAFLKAAVVSQDEKETGLRTILNYGHTIGHALEAVSGYGTWLHGEAVAVGMMGAARISQGMGLIPGEVVERQKGLLLAFGLPIRCPGVPVEALAQAMALDKKVRGKALRWVLLSKVGEAVVRDDVPQEMVLEVLEELVAP